jgi:23S rRNA (guanosine2251-2'-O)-methyltransferase
MTSKEEIYIYGKHPVTEALKASGGTRAIRELYITKQREGEPDFMSAVQSSNIKYHKVTEEEIESKVGRGAVHQGVCALVDTAGLYISLEEYLSAEKKENPCLVLLDELEDPHNVGAIVRSAVAFGASGILLPTHGQVHVTGTVAKTSAGTIFSIPLIKIGNVNTTLREMKEKGYWTYALTGSGDTSLHQAQFDSPTIIIIGSEGKGVREKTEELSDFKLSIPISEKCESLNASNAVAVTLYEWARQQSN